MDYNNTNINNIQSQVDDSDYITLGDNTISKYLCSNSSNYLNDDYMVVMNNLNNYGNIEEEYEPSEIFDNDIQFKNDFDDLLDSTDEVIVTGSPVYGENPKGSPIVPVKTVGKITRIRHFAPNTKTAYILYDVLFKNFNNNTNVINVFTSNSINKIY